MGCMVALQWRQFTGVRGGVRRLAKLEAADPSGSAKVSTGSGGRIVTRGVPGPGCVQSAQTAEVRSWAGTELGGLLTGHGEAAVEAFRAVFQRVVQQAWPRPARPSDVIPPM